MRILSLSSLDWFIQYFWFFLHVFWTHSFCLYDHVFSLWYLLIGFGFSSSTNLWLNYPSTPSINSTQLATAPIIQLKLNTLCLFPLSLHKKSVFQFRQQLGFRKEIEYFNTICLIYFFIALHVRIFVCGCVCVFF